MCIRDSARTARTFLQHFLINEGVSLEEKLKDFFKDKTSEAHIFIESLGLLSQTPAITQAATAAVILQSIIEKKWKLEQGDRDRIVMIHKISYMLGDDLRTMQSYMVVDGEDNERTAMAKTVGLPLAIAIDLFLNDKIAERGVVIPTSHQLSNNILSKLKTLGIHFTEVFV